MPKKPPVFSYPLPEFSTLIRWTVKDVLNWLAENNCAECHKIFRVAGIDGNKLINITETDLRRINCPSKKIKEILKFVSAVKVPAPPRFVGRQPKPALPARQHVAVATPSPLSPTQDDSDEDAGWGEDEFDSDSNEDNDDTGSDKSCDSPDTNMEAGPVPPPRNAKGRLPTPPNSATPPNVPQRRRLPPPPPDETPEDDQDDYEKPVPLGEIEVQVDYEEPDQALRPRAAIPTPALECDENYTDPDELKVKVQDTHNWPLPAIPGAGRPNIQPPRSDPPPKRNEPLPMPPRNTTLPMPPRNSPKTNVSSTIQKGPGPEVSNINRSPVVPSVIEPVLEEQAVYEDPDHPALPALPALPTLPALPARPNIPAPTPSPSHGATSQPPALPVRPAAPQTLPANGKEDLNDYLDMGEGLAACPPQDVQYKDNKSVPSKAKPNIVPRIAGRNAYPHSTSPKSRQRNPIPEPELEEEENYEVPDTDILLSPERMGAAHSSKYTTGGVSLFPPRSTPQKFTPSKQEVAKPEPPVADIPKPRDPPRATPARHNTAPQEPVTPVPSPTIQSRTLPLPPTPNATRTPTTGQTTAESSLAGQPWYHGDRSRLDVDENLLSRKMDGMYCIRKSTNANQPYTLAIYYGRVFNLPIREREGGKYAIGVEKPDELTYSTLVEMVNFFKKNFLVLPGNKQTNLKKSLPKT